MPRSKRVYDFIMKTWPLSKVAFRLARRPLFSPFIQPFLSPRSNQATYIPINEMISPPENVVLPQEILKPLLEQASTRFLMNECLCRTHENCSNFPQDLGCIFLGDGAAKISPTMGHPITPTEALDHVNQAVALGLLPLIVHTAFDAFTLNIPYNRMLTVCFCCDCCCGIRQGMRLGREAFWDIVQPLPGLKVEVTDDCLYCGTCVDECDIHALSLNHDRAVISSHCKGCGRCVEACPVGAITLSIPENGFVQHNLMARIREHTDIHPSGDR